MRKLMSILLVVVLFVALTCTTIVGCSNKDSTTQSAESSSIVSRSRNSVAPGATKSEQTEESTSTVETSNSTNDENSSSQAPSTSQEQPTSSEEGAGAVDPDDSMTQDY